MVGHRSIALALAALVSTAHIASAAANDGFMVRGYGASSCGTWSAFRKQGRSSSIGAEGWVLGYITGLNQGLGGDVTYGVDAEGIFAAIDKYCADEPTKDITSAAMEIVYRLGSRKIDEEINKITKDLPK